jgi:hypothetical protein
VLSLRSSASYESRPRLWPRACLYRIGQLLALSLGAWLGLPLTAALAEPFPVYLEWERPLGSTCPPAKVLEQDVEETLDRPVFTPRRTAQLVITGFIEEQGESTWVRLTARHRSGAVLGTRELHAVGGGCAALRSDIVLVLTLLVEREQILASPSVRASIGPAATLMLHVLPRWSAGAGLSLALDIADSLQLRLDPAYFFPVAVRTASGIAANLHALSLALRACPHVLGTSDSTWTLHACGGMQAGAWLVSQTEPSRHALQVRVLAHAMLELRAGVRLGEAAKLELSAGPSFAISRPTVYASYSPDTRELLYRVPFLGAQVQLGLAF